jgi:hypothetical protein
MGEEIAQTMYAHMNKQKIKKTLKKLVFMEKNRK